ncbi:myocilin opposite strand protein [Castor canadensis]|uniref:Myocilin opposite strand protein n=1 Tax=Castor canadensis TaxID=51338 RepID=A0AC58KJF8_CASCN
MAQKSSVDNTINLPYGDLASEVTRRRSNMAMREQMITKKNSDAEEIVSHLDTEEELSPGKVYPAVPPAPPPSPAENFTNCQASTT